MSSILKADIIQTADAAYSAATMSLSSIDNGWIPANETWTYASADSPTFTFTVAADVTTKYSAGMKIKLTQTTVKYFIITAVSAYSGGNTTITVYGGTDYTLANAVITDNYYSLVRAPLGFPMSSAKWTVETTDTSSRFKNSPAQNTWYNTDLGSISISIPIGVWKVNYQVCLYEYYASNFTTVQATLSTANNSESDSDLTVHVDGYQIASFTANRNKILTLAAKTTYYLNARTTTASTNNVYLMNDKSKCIIRAECVYL